MATETPPERGAPPERPPGKCWAVARTCGVCERCGFRPARNPATGRWDSHGGTCPLCGGIMRCIKDHVRERDKCRLHGGGSPKAGPTHHTYKTGRYSKALKGLGDLKAKYERARKDPELCSSQDEIAVLVGLTVQTLEAIGRDGNPRAALELQESLAIIASEFIRAADTVLGNDEICIRLRDLGEFNGEMARARQLVQDLIGYRSAVEHWRGLAEQVSKARERETKRIMATAAVVTMDQYNLIMAMIGETIMRHCDRAVVDAIHRDLSVSLAGVADAPLAVGAAAARG